MAADYIKGILDNMVHDIEDQQVVDQERLNSKITDLKNEVD